MMPCRKRSEGFEIIHERLVHCLPPTTCVRQNTKAKQSLYTPWRRLGGKEVQLLLIHDLGTRWGGWSASRQGSAFTPGARTPGTHLTGDWVGPRAGLDTEVRGKILCPCRGSNPHRPVVQPVVRHYTDWANPAPTKNTYLHNFGTLPYIIYIFIYIYS
jgi:hypothetical protein